MTNRPPTPLSIVGGVGTPPIRSLLSGVPLRQIAVMDGAIDTLVYELYGLTEKEIGIVEGNKPS